MRQSSFTHPTALNRMAAMAASMALPVMRPRPKVAMRGARAAARVPASRPGALRVAASSARFESATDDLQLGQVGPRR